jgi:heme ABC exporter ATP-binding subunit CcmA
LIPSTAAAITAEKIGRRFGIRWVLRGTTFDVQRGEVAALLGPNGSGKSTILRVLATLLKPNAGSAVVNGFDVVTQGELVRAEVGYLAHVPGLYDDLTARENLRFAADMLGISHRTIDESLDRVGLAGMRDARARGFSAGMQRRLGLARLIMRKPRILLLDEPYSNLDTQGIELMNSIIAEVISAGGAALLALHELAPARDVLDRTLTLVDGRIESSLDFGAGREAPARMASL